MNRTLARVVSRNHALVHRLTEGVAEEAAFTPLVEGGSHLAWLVAHLVASRDAALELLGAPRARPAELDARFAYGSRPPQPGEGGSFADHLAAFDATREPLLAALAELTPEQLAAPSGKSTLGERLEFQLWHETYHLGQLTLYRRAAGLPSPIG